MPLLTIFASFYAQSGYICMYDLIYMYNTHLHTYTCIISMYNVKLKNFVIKLDIFNAFKIPYVHRSIEYINFSAIFLTVKICYKMKVLVSEILMHIKYTIICVQNLIQIVRLIYSIREALKNRV